MKKEKFLFTKNYKSIFRVSSENFRDNYFRGHMQIYKTSRKKSLMLRSTTAKVNDRLHIKSHTWAVSNADVFASR